MAPSVLPLERQVSMIVQQSGASGVRECTPTYGANAQMSQKVCSDNLVEHSAPVCCVWPAIVPADRAVNWKLEMLHQKQLGLTM